MRNNNVMLTIFLLFIISFQIKGAAMGERPDYREEIREKFKKIDFSRSISKEEAIIIAQNYLIEKRLDKDCNIFKPEVGESKLLDNCWAVSFNATFKIKIETGLKWFTLSIDRKTGEIKGQGWGPS